MQCSHCSEYRLFPVVKNSYWYDPSQDNDATTFHGVVECRTDNSMRFVSSKRGIPGPGYSEILHILWTHTLHLPTAILFPTPFMYPSRNITDIHLVSGNLKEKHSISTSFSFCSKYEVALLIFPLEWTIEDHIPPFDDGYSLQQNRFPVVPWFYFLIWFENRGILWHASIQTFSWWNCLCSSSLWMINSSV